MGGAKWLSKVKELPKSKEELAFEYFLYWVVSGLVITFGLAILVLRKPNFLIPIIFYFIISILLFCRYLKLDLKGGLKQNDKKTKISN